MPEKTHIGTISIKIIRHYRNAEMTLIGHASLARRITSRERFRFYVVQKDVEENNADPYRARRRRYILLREKRKLLYDAHKMPFMVARERIPAAEKGPAVSSPAKFARDQRGSFSVAAAAWQGVAFRDLN